MRALLLLGLLLPSLAHARELAGVTLPDTATVGGQTLTLNGMGLREFLFIDIYVGGLYLPQRTTDAREAIEADVPKRIVMHFIYKSVSRDKVVSTFRDGLAKQKDYGDLKAELAKLEAFMDRDMVSGDRVILDYVPGQGVSITINDTLKGKVGDVRFMKALWSIFLGSSPASNKLKAGMLGQ